MECLLMYLSIYSWGVITAFILISVLNHLWLYRINRNPDLPEVLFITILSWLGVIIIVVVSSIIYCGQIQDTINGSENKFIKMLKKITGVG
jgi:hypothetical protein